MFAGMSLAGRSKAFLEVREWPEKDNAERYFSVTFREEGALHGPDICIFLSKEQMVQVADTMAHMIHMDDDEPNKTWALNVDMSTSK